MTNHVIIMAGGVGSRLYPISTPEHPKQFIDLLGCGKTMIQLTKARFEASIPGAVFWVVTSERYADQVKEQIPDLPNSRLLLEPMPRNTAPCIAYACRKIRSECSDANIVVTPADAWVPDIEAFGKTIRKALTFTSANDAIVCIGISPTEPHTGYGYIHIGPITDIDKNTGQKDAGHSPADSDNEKGEKNRINKVEAFKEKPCREVAEAYLEAGGYTWNAGIFVWSAETIESQLKKYAPGIEAVMDKLEESFGSIEEKSTLENLFPTCESISIDYAVMEKSDRIYTISADWEWSDLGSIEALDKVLKKLKY